MKTAQEILAQYESFRWTDDGLDETHYYHDNVLMAMEEYAASRIEELNKETDKIPDIMGCYNGEVSHLLLNDNELQNEVVIVIDLTSDGVPFCVGDNFEGWVPLLSNDK